MERLADLTAKIDNAEKLEAVVTAIRGIAAARAQEARSLLVGVESYAKVVAAAIGAVLRLPHAVGEPGGPERVGEVIFLAEQGFVGAFNESVLKAATGSLEGATVLILGTRGAAIAAERGIRADWTTPMPSQVGGVPGTAGRLAEALYESIERLGLTRIELTFAEPATGGGYTVRRQSLLPLDLSQFAKHQNTEPPLTNLPPADLLRQLADEYVYARLCAAATLAFAAENEARLAAMIAARTSVQRTVGDLHSRASQARQREVTEEVVALAASAAALTDGTGYSAVHTGRKSSVTQASRTFEP